MAAQYNAVLAEQNAKIQQIQEENCSRRGSKKSRRGPSGSRSSRGSPARQKQQDRQQQKRPQAVLQIIQQRQTTHRPAQEAPPRQQHRLTEEALTMILRPAIPAARMIPAAPAAPESATGSAIVSYATQFIGNPYVWGGTSLTNGADCSGFIMSVYAHFGYDLPHSSSDCVV